MGGNHKKQLGGKMINIKEIEELLGPRFSKGDMNYSQLLDEDLPACIAWIKEAREVLEIAKTAVPCGSEIASEIERLLGEAEFD
jgi:hypothetical protein